MRKEVSFMFEEKIWKIVSKQEMRYFYDKQRVHDIDIKLERLMMIWSFKSKRHPDETLNKHKVRLCCYGEQQ